MSQNGQTQFKNLAVFACVKGLNAFYIEMDG